MSNMSLMTFYESFNSTFQFIISKLSNQFYHHYELIFNISCIVSASSILRYSDIYIDCKREEENSMNFNSFYLYMNDFISASYGYDSQCQKWKYFLQTFTLSWLVFSLVCLINQMEDCIYHSYFFKYKNIYDCLRKLMVGFILANYCPKIYSTFLLTNCGHMIHNMLWTSYLHYNTNFPFLEHHFSKLKPILDRMKINLI